MLYKNAKKTLNEINHHKVFFIGLVIIQTLFVIAFAFSFLNFHLKILEDARGIIEPLQEANYNPDTIDAGQPFLDDPLAVYQSYQAMVRDVYWLVGWLLLIFIFFGGLLWTGSHQMLSHQKFSIKKFTQMWSKFVATFLVLIIPFLALCYYIIRLVLFANEPTEVFSSYLKVIGIVFIIIYYFTLTTFSSITLPWKSFVRRSFEKTKNLPKTIPVLLINTALVSFGIYLIYRTLVNQQLTSYMIFATFVLIVIFVITRLYWIICIKDEKNIS